MKRLDIVIFIASIAVFVIGVLLSIQRPDKKIQEVGERIDSAMTVLKNEVKAEVRLGISKIDSTVTKIDSIYYLIEKQDAEFKQKLNAMQKSLIVKKQELNSIQKDIYKLPEITEK